MGRVKDNKMKPSNEDKKCDNTSATNIAESAAADGGGVVAAEVADSAAGSNPPNKPYHGGRSWCQVASDWASFAVG